MKSLAAVSSLIVLGTLGLFLSNLLVHEQDLHLTFSEEDIYSEL